MLHIASKSSHFEPIEVLDGIRERMGPCGSLDIGCIVGELNNLVMHAMMALHT